MSATPNLIEPTPDIVRHDSTPTVGYWDDLAGRWQGSPGTRTWRMISDAVNEALLARWLPAAGGGSVLKTDLFDEIVGAGLVPQLSRSFTSVTGIDISPVLVDMARARFPHLRAEAADVRQLPFRDGEFDTVISNSTLDHFATHEDIAVAVRELHRVMRTQGTLLVTMDNPLNPVVAIRNALPQGVRRATHLVPFAVGATYGPRGLRHLLERTGFEVVRTGAVFHCPRALVVLGGHWIDAHASAGFKRRYARFWTSFEALGVLPTRYVTGHFVAVLARKR